MKKLLLMILALALALSAGAAFGATAQEITLKVTPGEDDSDAKIFGTIADALFYASDEQEDDDGRTFGPFPVVTIEITDDLDEDALEDVAEYLGEDSTFTAITIKSDGSRKNIVSPAADRHFVINNSGLTLTLENITLTGNADSHGGGIWLQDGALIANNVTFTGNDAGGLSNYEEDDEYSYGGALHITGSNATAALNNCTFSGNTAEYGGAVRAKAGTLSIAGGTFSDNGQATDYINGTERGGAIYINSGATVTISETPTFSGNIAAEYGGAIYSLTPITITAGTFTGNMSEQYGGAIYLENTSGSTITGASFGSSTSPNSAPYGGAIYTSGGSVTISSTAFTNNSADLGGAISTSSNGTVILGESTTFTDNKANSGGALYILSGAEFSNTGTVTFSGNKAIYGGAVWAASGTSVNGFTSSVNFTGNTADYGGALYVYEQGASLVLDSSKLWSFSRNTADYDGGAIYTLSADVLIDGIEITGNANTAVQGGGFLRSGGTATVRNASISGQSAQYGGAIYSAGSVTIENGTFTDNRATATTGTLPGGGGAVYVVGSITVSSSDFSNNYSTSTYRSHGGGAIFVSGDATIEGSEFTGNIHQNSDTSNRNGGGAIYVHGTISVTSSKFTSNSAAGSSQSWGGAIYADEAGVAITDSLFQSNKSARNGGAIVLAGGCSSTVKQSTFTDNVSSAGYGGGIYAQGNLTITQSYFSTNRSYENGGAVFFDQHGNVGYGTISVESSYFSMNSAGIAPSTRGWGGALYISPEVAEINRCTFDSNQVSSSNGTSYGGGVYVDISDSVSATPSSVKNSIFFGNAAADGETNYGAGLYTKGDISISSNTFVNNTASGTTSRGGGIYADVGTLTITACIVVGNVGNIGRDVYAEGTITSRGYNRIGVYGKGGSNTSWLADVSGSTTDKESTSWTTATFFGNDAQLVDSYGNYTAPEVGCSASPALLLAIFLNEDDTLPLSDRATNKIPYSKRYTLNIEQYDIWGIDRFANGTDITIGATDFGSGSGGSDDGGDGSFDIKTITMSAIPNSLKYPGQTASLIAMITYSNGEVAYGVPANSTTIVLNKQERVIWSSSNANAVTVDQYGNVTALRATNGTNGVTISVQTVRNALGGYPAIAQKVVVITDNNGYNFMNLSPEYYNYLTQNVFPILFEYDLSASIANLNPSIVSSSTFRSNFAKVWSAVFPTQITDLTASTPTIAPSTAAPYLAGMTASKRAAVSINYANRSAGELFPMTYSWTFTGSEITAVMGYDMTSVRTINNATVAGNIFEKFCIAYQGNNQVIHVIGGSGISGAEAFESGALVLSYADGGAGLHVDLTVYVGNLAVTGNYDGAQVIRGSGTGKAFVVPDGVADGAIAGSMWMFQPAGTKTNTDTNPNPNPNINTGSGGGGGGCNSAGFGLVGAIVLLLKRRR